MPRRPEKNRLSPQWWEAKTEVDPATGCRNWKGFTSNGYGRLLFKKRYGFLAHRAAYECFYGTFDTAFDVCHTCDNRRCVNPYHLFLGTQQDNMRDMFAKGRARPNGSANFRRKAPVATPLLASEIPHASVVSDDRIHLMRTLAPMESGDQVTPVWCRVTGVPAKRPTRAIVLWRRPIKWTPEPADSTDSDVEGRDAGGMLQLAISGSCLPLSASPRRAHRGQR